MKVIPLSSFFTFHILINWTLCPLDAPFWLRGPALPLKRAPKQRLFIFMHQGDSHIKHLRAEAVAGNANRI